MKALYMYLQDLYNVMYFMPIITTCKILVIVTRYFHWYTCTSCMYMYNALIHVYVMHVHVRVHVHVQIQPLIMIV